MCKIRVEGISDDLGETMVPVDEAFLRDAQIPARLNFRQWTLGPSGSDIFATLEQIPIASWASSRLKIAGHSGRQSRKSYGGFRITKFRPTTGFLVSMLDNGLALKKSCESTMVAPQSLQ